MPDKFIPFSFSEKGEFLSSFYPDANVLKSIYRKLSEQDRFGILHSFITEGIPYIYKENPLAYEAIRSFIAQRLQLNPKQVVLIGSGRVGYSLSRKEWGKPFDSSSDLDFALISQPLFQALVKNLNSWIDDLKSRRLNPSLEEMQNWLSNIDVLKNSLDRGFLQSSLFPYTDNYLTAKKLQSTMWLLKKRISATNNVPQIAKSSIRVYFDWSHCLKQLYITFNHAIS